MYRGHHSRLVEDAFALDDEEHAVKTDGGDGEEAHTA